MKKTVLAIATLILFCSILAPGQTFGFASAESIYCNYEQLSYYGGGLWAGTDNLSVCGLDRNATISGFSARVTKNKGLGVYGPGVIYGDTLYATLYGWTAVQWTVYTKTQCNKQNKHGQYVGGYSWIGVAGFSGFFGGTNAGYLFCGIPPRNGVVPTLGPTIAPARRVTETR